jgi:hypothetical protein
MDCGSLDVDIIIDENLALKSPHHYLVKLCKKNSDVSLQLDFEKPSDQFLGLIVMSY